MSEPRSVYIHVPFCAHRCGYCDFTLVAGRDDLMERYLDALEVEIARTLTAANTEKPKLETLFLGGGTPTHLSRPALDRLLQMLGQQFELSDQTEFSVEANPAGLSNDKLDLLRHAGVNRLSLGVQALDDQLLAVLERDHRRADIPDCVERCRERFPNVSLDLIFAVPGQSLDQWRATLREAIAMQPQHVSTYGLTFEKGTTFWSRRESGRLASLDDELEREMYAAVMNDLTTAGFEQYEISSFAKPGFRCRHNQIYWTGGSWWGFGPGAAGMINGCRTLNHRSTTTWIRKTLAGEDAVMDRETLSEPDRVRELLVLGLRRIEGVSASWFQQMTGLILSDFSVPTISRLIRKGWLELFDERLRLTLEGRFFFDSVAGELLTN